MKGALLVILAALVHAALAKTMSTSTNRIFTGTYSAQSISTSACIFPPAATSTLAAYHGKVKGQEYTLYGPADGTTEPQILLHTDKKAQAVLFDLRNASRIQYFLDNGTRGYVDDSGVYLYTAACDTLVSMSVPGFYSMATKGQLSRRAQSVAPAQTQAGSRRSEDAASLNVQVVLKDQCGHPVPDLEASLLCRVIAEPEMDYALTDSSDDGNYLGSCPFPDTEAMNANCESTTKQYLDYIIGDASGAAQYSAGQGASFMKKVVEAGVTKGIIGAGVAVVSGPVLEVVGLALQALGAFTTAVYLYGGHTTNEAGVEKLAAAFCARRYASFEYMAYAVIANVTNGLGDFTTPPAGTVTTRLRTSLMTITKCLTSSSSTSKTKTATHTGDLQCPGCCCGDKACCPPCDEFCAPNACAICNCDDGNPNCRAWCPRSGSGCRQLGNGYWVQ